MQHQPPPTGLAGDAGTTPTGHAIAHRAAVLLSVVFVATLVGACGGNGDQEQQEGPTTSVAQITNEADVLLNAALQAHVEARLDDAAVLYQQVLLADPDNKFAHFNVGLLAQAAGDLSGSTAAYESALSIDPQYIPALFNLAIVVTESDPDRAVELYRQATAADDTYAAAHLNLGVMLLTTGSEDEGLEEINRAYELDPSLVLGTPAGSGQP